MRFTTSFALSAGLLLASTFSAAAWQATTTSTTNVRSGPGTRYGVIGSLPAGSVIEVVGCSGSWCQTQYGYVSSRLVSQGASYGAMGAQPYGAQPYGVRQPYATQPYAAARPYAAPGYGAGSPGTNYRQPVNTAAPQATPFLPAQATTAPSTVPSSGTNYRQPYGTTAPAAGSTTPTYNAQAGAALGSSAVGPVAAGSFGTMHGARTTIGETNVRSGPGVEYSVIKTLPDFTKVEVESCANTWCQTDEGYISLFHLSRGPVQQVLNSAAQPLLPGSGSRDSIYYAGNQAAQATMGYGAGGQGGVAPGMAPGMAPGIPGMGVAPMAASDIHFDSQIARRAAAQAQARYGGSSPAAYGQPNYGATPYGATGGQATVRSTANVRSGPGTRYGVIGALPAGSVVDVMSCSGSWCQTQYGYVSSRLVSQGGLAPGYGTQPYGAGQPYSSTQPYGATQAYGTGRAYATPAAALASAYRQPVQPAARPYLPAQQAAAPAMVPSAGTNYRQPYGTTAPAAPTLPQGVASSAMAYQDPRRYTAPPAGYGQAGGSATYAVTALNVRSGPGLNYGVIGTVPAGTPVNVVGCSGSWCQTEYGYVSTRYLSTSGNVSLGAASTGTLSAAPTYQAPASARVTVRPSSQAGYSGAGYTAPLNRSGAGYYPASTTSALDAVYPNPSYPLYPPYPEYPTYNTPSLGNLVYDVTMPVVDVAAAVTSAFTFNDYRGSASYAPANYGTTNWRASWGPRYSSGTRPSTGPAYYWGPAQRGRNTYGNWGARPSYWGGTPTYWNVHPGYATRAYRGDKRGNMYWSKRNEGRRPQSDVWYSGLYSDIGPHWQGPYEAGPGYYGRPVVWRPRSGIY